jgi:hypothetical protein
MKKRLFILLVLLMAPAAASAVTIVVNDVGDIVKSSTSTTIIVSESNGVYTYNFIVNNLSDNYLLASGNGYEAVGPFIVDYEIPIYTSDMIFGGIDSVTSPLFWSASLLSRELYIAQFGQDSQFDSDYVLHWHNEGFAQGEGAIAPYGYSSLGETYDGKPVAGTQANFHQETLTGFGLESTYYPFDSPYSTAWATNVWNIGSAPLRRSFFTGGDSLTASNPIPEPATLLLLGAGLLGISHLRRRTEK